MPTQFQYDDAATKTLSPLTRQAIAEQLKIDINAWCVEHFTDEHRHHLGASVIGNECDRFIWYAFRWVKFEIFDGRMLRLFDTGHQEEARFIKWLRGIGCKVWEVDPETGKQFRIWAVSGHYGGSADAKGILPYLPDLPILLEFKTHNTKSFVNLVNKKSVQLAKPRHYAQMCSYGKQFGYHYGLYAANNKNDDDIYLELVELDWRLSDDLIKKAADIITSKVPPPRISESPAYFACKFCPYSEICFSNEPVERNCRSCKSAKPIEGAEWYCHRWNKIIPRDFLKQGCDGHVSIAI